MFRNSIVIFILSFIIMITIIVWDSDDFTPHIRYEKEIDVLTTSNFSCIDDVVDELSRIAQKYQNGVKLTNAIIILDGSKEIESEKGIILFDYYKSSDSKNQITKVLLSYDMSSGTVDRIKFEQGHGKRVDGYSTPINKELSKIPISQLMSDLYNDQDFKDKVNMSDLRLEISYSHEICIQLYENKKNQGPVYIKRLNSTLLEVKDTIKSYSCEVSNNELL